MGDSACPTEGSVRSTAASPTCFWHGLEKSEKVTRRPAPSDTSRIPDVMRLVRAEGWRRASSQLREIQRFLLQERAQQLDLGGSFGSGGGAVSWWVRAGEL